LVKEGIIDPNDPNPENVPLLMRDKHPLFHLVFKYEIPPQDQFDYFDENYKPSDLPISNKKLADIFPNAMIENNNESSDSDESDEIEP
jgi:hypothetical protein